MRSAVWGIEWRMALTDRRRFVLSTFVPLALVLSVAGGAIPSGPAAAVHLLIFVSFMTFGSAIPMRWESERGMSARVVRGGVPASAYLVHRAGACASVDVAQLGPALAALALVAGASVGDFLVALAALAVTAWVAGLIGVLVAAASRSVAETGLMSALAVLLFAHMSGVFGWPAPESPAAVMEAASPFRALHEALVGLTAPAERAGYGSAVVWAILLPVLVTRGGGRLHAWLGQVRKGGLEGV